MAMSFAGNWHHAYLASSHKERRRLNRAIFQKIFVLDNGQISDEMAEPFKTLLGRQVIEAATARFHLTRDESQAIDKAWAELSGKWAEEQGDESLLVGATTGMGKTQTPDTLSAGGLKQCFVVGVEGLEPPTSAL